MYLSFRNMKHSTARGFTLMELLVSVAIIGMLSSIVLTSVASARTKGVNAAIKSNLAGARAEAALYYGDAGNSYEGVCAASGADRIGDSVSAAEIGYKGSVTGYGDAVASTWDTAQCHDSANAWAAWVPLRGSTSGSILAWCVDGLGVSKQVTTVLAASAMQCP